MKAKTKYIALAILVAAGGLSISAHAADANTGKNLAANCTFCHGTDGRSVGGFPNLAGQDKGYLALQLKDFKAGRRAATIMHQIAKGYTDDQIELLAEFFSAQKSN